MAPLRRRGFWLEYASMGWMTVEAAVAVIAGIIASPIALIGLGLDSVIEFFAASVVVWQLRGTAGEERETRALRLIGVTFHCPRGRKHRGSGQPDASPRVRARYGGHGRGPDRGAGSCPGQNGVPGSGWATGR
jgi:hypothetical protein